MLSLHQPTKRVGNKNRGEKNMADKMKILHIDCYYKDTIVKKLQLKYHIVIIDILLIL